MERKVTTVFQAFRDARYKKKLGSFSYVMQRIAGLDTNRDLLFFFCRNLK